MNGYYNMDSKEYFDKDGFFKSGDIAYFDEDNCFYIVGRIKEVFKYKGWHIIPAVIENILDSHPDVKESAVVGIPAENHGECPVGIVVLKDGSQSSAEDIKKFVDDQLSDNQKLEGGIRIFKELIYTSTGKIKKAVLRDMIMSNK